MGNIVITGASSGIGAAIAHYFYTKGHHIIALGRHLDTALPYEIIACDLTERKELKAILQQLKKREISGLVNGAGIGLFEPHEELDFTHINSLLDINLHAPILLSNALLRALKASKGFIINLSSIEATRHAKFSALYSASKAGLRSFGLSLFEEVRKSGVQVITLNLDMTDTPFFDTLHFKPHKEAALDVQSICDTVDMALKLPQNATVTELTLRPQYLKIEKRPKHAKK